MYYLTKIDGSAAVTPPLYRPSSVGYTSQVLVNRSTGSPHMSLKIGHLTANGHIDQVLHSFEVSIYVLSGAIAITMLGSTVRLTADHCVVVPVGTAYSIRSSVDATKWLEVNAPAELEDGRREDTFFTGQPTNETEPVLPDMRDPRSQYAFRFDSSSMDLKRLAGGSDVNAPEASPSMATALLAYSGIGVKMLVDQRTGAQLHTTFVVDYQPTAIAHPHDHPFEEAYLFVKGQVHALVDGDELVLGPGDLLWAGVGADHGFENRGTELVRWIEVQAPQPPSRHSYRFSREWEHLAQKLEEEL
jgi:mannose-6-phosphate isomerase-like protein (cupin superfamily)